jgi:hypothetical protein
MLQRESSSACMSKYCEFLKTIFLAAVAATLLYACQKKDDTDPEFLSIRLNQNLLSDSSEVQAGNTIVMQLECSDDNGLNQLRIDVSSGLTTNFGTWQDFYVGELSGTSKTVSKVFQIPDTIEGDWQIDFDLIDDSGNQADTETTVLRVTNDLLPEIDINSINGEPFDLAGMLFSSNTALNFDGNVSDLDGLALVRLQIYENSSEVQFIEWELPDNPTVWSMSQIELTSPDSAISWIAEFQVYDVEGYRYALSFPILSQ